MTLSFAEDVKILLKSIAGSKDMKFDPNVLCTIDDYAQNPTLNALQHIVTTNCQNHIE